MLLNLPKLLYGITAELGDKLGDERRGYLFLMVTAFSA